MSSFLLPLLVVLAILLTFGKSTETELKPNSLGALMEGEERALSPAKFEALQWLVEQQIGGMIRYWRKQLGEGPNQQRESPQQKGECKSPEEVYRMFLRREQFERELLATSGLTCLELIHAGLAAKLEQNRVYMDQNGNGVSDALEGQQAIDKFFAQKEQLKDRQREKFAEWADIRNQLNTALHIRKGFLHLEEAKNAIGFSCFKLGAEDLSRFWCNNWKNLYEEVDKFLDAWEKVDERVDALKETKMYMDWSPEKRVAEETRLSAIIFEPQFYAPSHPKQKREGIVDAVTKIIAARKVFPNLLTLVAKDPRHLPTEILQIDNRPKWDQQIVEWQRALEEEDPKMEEVEAVQEPSQPQNKPSALEQHESARKQSRRKSRKPSLFKRLISCGGNSCLHTDGGEQ